MQPYYDADGITIYHGDCMDILPDLTADILVTDPPYGVDKADWDRAFPLELLHLAAARVSSAAVMPGVWNIGAMPEHLAHLAYRWTLSAYLSNGMTRGAVGFCNWIPCLLYSADDVGLWRQDGDARSFVVGTEPKPEHPSPKPYRVMSWVISRMPAAGIVLDPFAGSGTTLRAAKDLGRKAIGIEIEERYCEIAASRLAQGVLALEAS